MLRIGLLVASIALIIHGCQGCTHGFTQLGEYCYGFFKQTVTWVEAASTCRAHQAFLAEPKTLVENMFIKGLVLQNDGGDTWLGATDDLHEGQWYWGHSGSLVSGFTDWAPGEPSNSAIHGEVDCLQMYKKQDLHWDDQRCSEKNNFVCQMPASDVVVG